MILACQRDATARAGRFDVRSVVRQGDEWHARLDDTVLYPEGGGQPSDHGTVAGVRVRSLHRVEDGVVHVLDGPIPTGPADVVVDWRRRFDHMQQHTGQHLLTAVAQDELGLRTTSFHLHEGLDAACDIELDGELREPAGLEARVNALVREGRPVRVRAAAPSELDGVRTRGLPEGLDVVRLVEIAGVDTNTCGGTHVASTAELQAVALLGTERLRGGTRLRFAVGDRVLHRLRVAEARLAECGALLSRSAADVPEGVRRALDDAKAAAKAREALAADLADAVAAALLADPSPVRVLHRDDADPAFLSRVAATVARGAPDAVLWLTAGAEAFVLAGPPPLIGAVRAEVLALLDARGGGPPGRLQGKAARLDRRGEVERLLRSR